MYMILSNPQLFSFILNIILGFLLCAQYTVLRSVNLVHRNVMEILPQIVGGIGVFLSSCGSPIYTACGRMKKDRVRLTGR